MTIREQIKALPLPESVIERIITYTTLAQAYNLDLHTSEFLLTQAFDWGTTIEGAEYWFSIFQTIEYHKQNQTKNKI